MSVAVIACKMIENETEKILNNLGFMPKVYLVDAGLHNTPIILHEKLQTILNDLPKDTSRVILTYSLCGQAALGLKTGDFELFMPKTDDCIALLLGGNEVKTQNNGTYYLTDHWIHDDNSLMNEYNYTLEKYGSDRCNRIFKRQFEHYNTLGLLDTGCYDIENLRSLVENIASILELEIKPIPTDFKILTSLLSYCDEKTKYDKENENNSKILYIDKYDEITLEKIRGV